MPTLPDGTQLPYPGDEQAQSNPLQDVQEAIQSIHSLMASLPDAKHTQAAGKALMALLGIQQEIMGASQQPADPRQALLSQLGA